MSEQPDDRQAAEADGYEIHTAGAEHSTLAGRFWWTLYRPGWSEVETSDKDFATEDEAWVNALAHRAGELARKEPFGP